MNPTKQTYDDLTRAYAFFNDRLFSGTLPPCLITMQRKNKAYGYFAGDRFGTRDGGATTDEIALNPSHFTRSPEEVLSTLAHEMAHLWQHHHGKPSRTAYHNKEWAAKMKEIGLIPSDTGAPGGKETGQKVSHYIEAGGAFAVAVAALMEAGPVAFYVERWGDEGKRKKKAASKTKYTCPTCAANVWGKPDMLVICGEDGALMEAETSDGEDAE